MEIYLFIYLLENFHVLNSTFNFSLNDLLIFIKKIWDSKLSWNKAEIKMRVKCGKLKNEKWEIFKCEQKKGTRNLYGTGPPATAHPALRFIEPEPTVSQPSVA